jgi:hypothetical protein
MMTTFREIVPYLVLPAWVLLSFLLWRGNHRRWNLGIADLVTVSVLILVGLTFIGLAIGP